jgi:hypothetical protein
MDAAIDAHEAALDVQPVDRDATFADAAERWLHHLEHVEGAKPSTIADYRNYLAPVVAAALIDRLIHAAHMVTLKGKSYQLRERAAGAAPAVQAPGLRPSA